MSCFHQLPLPPRAQSTSLLRGCWLCGFAILYRLTRNLGGWKDSPPVSVRRAEGPGVVRVKCVASEATRLLGFKTLVCSAMVGLGASVLAPESWFL